MRAIESNSFLISYFQGQSKCSEFVRCTRTFADGEAIPKQILKVFAILLIPMFLVLFESYLSYDTFIGTERKGGEKNKEKETDQVST